MFMDFLKSESPRVVNLNAFSFRVAASCFSSPADRSKLLTVAVTCRQSTPCPRPSRPARTRRGAGSTTPLTWCFSKRYSGGPRRKRCFTSSSGFYWQNQVQSKERQWHPWCPFSTKYIKMLNSNFIKAAPGYLGGFLSKPAETLQ